MGCRAVHFSIDADTVAELLEATTDDDRREVIEFIEEDLWSENPDIGYETDKAWDAIHRCLTDGTLAPGEGPLAKFVLGGKSIHQGDDHILCVVSPQEAAAAAVAARDMNEAEFRNRYSRLSQDQTGWQPSEEDFEYTWGWFENLPKFFADSAAKGRWIVVSIDQ